MIEVTKDTHNGIPLVKKFEFDESMFDFQHDNEKDLVLARLKPSVIKDIEGLLQERDRYLVSKFATVVVHNSWNGYEHTVKSILERFEDRCGALLRQLFTDYRQGYFRTYIDARYDSLQEALLDLYGSGAGELKKTHDRLMSMYEQTKKDLTEVEELIYHGARQNLLQFIEADVDDKDLRKNLRLRIEYGEVLGRNVKKFLDFRGVGE